MIVYYFSGGTLRSGDSIVARGSIEDCIAAAESDMLAAGISGAWQVLSPDHETCYYPAGAVPARRPAPVLGMPLDELAMFETRREYVDRSVPGPAPLGPHAKATRPPPRGQLPDVSTVDLDSIDITSLDLDVLEAAEQSVIDGRLTEALTDLQHEIDLLPYVAIALGKR